MHARRKDDNSMAVSTGKLVHAMFAGIAYRIISMHCYISAVQYANADVCM